MKKIIGISTLLLVFFLSLGAPMPVSSQPGTTVSVSPSSITLDPGDTASLDIQIDLASGESIRGFSVEIHFNPGRSSASNLTQGDFLNTLFPSPDNSIDNEEGVIIFGVVQGAEEPASGSGTLFSFDIQAKEIPGSTSIEIFVADLVDKDFFLLDYDVVNGEVNITGEIEYPYQVYLPLVLR
jgi:hypothetical protein